ncbi:acyltransferase domain-containing protein [Streptomyces sp. NRRL S-646]|uniref:acyltransferase domain-containing protein n=1 Tax=Streptomyces sp. NRRL S-646 TaxID=1463917 RepID=UPI000AA129AE|nr:acyltransferase domain-containing protein [Streptomyces sp. NRRL S-646]
MPRRTAFLFPGLGAYSPGMLAQARQDHTQVTETLDAIDRLSAEHGVPPVSDVLFGAVPPAIDEMMDRPAELLQMAIFGASVATHRLLVDAGVRPYALVGHSFGEIAALVCSGAFTLEDGVRLVCARAEALQEWEGRGAMAAVGADEELVGHLIGALDEPDLVIGCVNGPRQTVISGPVDAIERAGKAAAALDLFFTRLYLPYASHHPSMRGAVTRFIMLTEGIGQRPMDHPVISPIHGRRYADGDDLLRLLGECLVLPVRFTDTVRQLHARGVTGYVETGALKALTRCAELTVPGITTYAPLLDPERESEALRSVITDCGDSAWAPPPPSTPEAAPAPTDEGDEHEPAPGIPEPASADREAVLGRLRDLYGQALEYPPEILTADARLEAELGVDSLKQTALLVRVAEEFKLAEGSRGLRILELNSLGAIADHVIAHADGQAVR